MLPLPPVVVVSQDLIDSALAVISATQLHLKLFDDPLPPAPPPPPGVTDWYHTSQRPYRDGIWEIQQTFGEVLRLHFNAKKDCWYYIAEDNRSVGPMCCMGDSLHLIASGWRGLTAPAEVEE